MELARNRLRNVSTRRVLAGGFAGAAGFLMLAGTSSGVQAGFLDQLFGRARARVYSAPPAYDGYGNPYGEYEAAPRRRRAPRAHATTTTPQAAKVEALCCKNGGNPMKAIMQDDTLVAGDIVMTPNGLRTFVGSRTPHSEDDFVDISRSRYVSKSQRKQLLALDR
ncbi:MAG: hypothetical protein JWL62_2348 [Hyphomicrobiales bacterium]|nr:hypothetical protein [Hyphomicrobiales bacterium]